VGRVETHLADPIKRLGMVLNDCKEFVEKYSDKSMVALLRKAFKCTSNATKIRELNKRIDRCASDLALIHQIDTERRRQEDLEVIRTFPYSVISAVLILFGYHTLLGMTSRISVQILRIQ
jgi:hypothetical protein